MDKLETWPFGNMAMFIAAPVVGQGVSRADLWHLTNTFGMLQNLRSWQDTPLAARGRVALVPPLRPGGPLLFVLCRELVEARRHTEFPERELVFRQWLEAAPATIIDMAMGKFREVGVGPATIFRDIRDRLRGGDPIQVAQRARRHVPKERVQL